MADVTPVKMILSTRLLLAATALLDVAAAGPKKPRYKDVVATRDYPTTPASVAVNVLTKTGVRNDTAPNLYGWMFEDINHSGEGGLYGELLVNRAFDGSDVRFGAIPGFVGNGIVYQENTCVPTG